MQESAPTNADAAARALRGLFRAPLSSPAAARPSPNCSPCADKLPGFRPPRVGCSQAGPPEQGDADEGAAARGDISAAWMWLAVRACAASGSRIGSRTVPLREAQHAAAELQADPTDGGAEARSARASPEAPPLPRSASVGHLRAARSSTTTPAGRPAEERGLVQHLHGQVRSLEQRLQASEKRVAELEGAAGAGPAETGHLRPVSPSRRAARHAGLCRDLEGLLAKQGQSRQAIVEELRTFVVDHRGRAHGDKTERSHRGPRSPRGEQTDGGRTLQRASARGGA